MHRTVSTLVPILLWLVPGASSAAIVQDLKRCVDKSMAQLGACIRANGQANAPVCRTGIHMEISVCAETHDPAQRRATDPARHKILFDACLKLHNPGTGQTARQECTLTFPFKAR